MDNLLGELFGERRSFGERKPSFGGRKPFNRNGGGRSSGGFRRGE